MLQYLIVELLYANPLKIKRSRNKIINIFLYVAKSFVLLVTFHIVVLFI